jgi:hypothetical protein
MQKPRDDVCGCCGSRPRELRHLIDMLERQAAERKEERARDEKRKPAGGSQAFGNHSDK